MNGKLVTAVILALGLASSASAVDSGVQSTRFELKKAGEDGIPAGWVMHITTGTPSKYFESDRKVKSFCVKSNSSSFSVQRAILVDTRKYPYVTWRWKVKELPDGGDFRRYSRDDQAAQLFVAFDGRKKSINYIWDTSAPVGATGTFSVLAYKVRTVVVGSGPAEVGKWVTVTRNVFEDYRSLFGKDPPIADGLRFQINSQHTGTVAEACLESVEFRSSL